jgi:hypothetical protein
MSGDAQPAEIDGEYRFKEKRKQKALDSKHSVTKLTAQLLAKDYDVNLSTGYFKSDGVDHQQLPTDLHKCVGESQLTTVKCSKLDTLDTYDTESVVFIGKFMTVNYFTCLDDIANAIDDLFDLEDLYVSATSSATRAAKSKKQAPQQQMTVVTAPARPHAGRGGGAGQRPPATTPIEAVVDLP